VHDPAPCESVRYVNVPALRRPIALLYVIYHLSSLTRYSLRRTARRDKFDLIQSGETFFSLADLYYVHFCNRAYLKLKPSPIRLNSLRGWSNWFDHLVQAFVEPLAFRRARAIVACSRGLARDIVREYPFCRDKIHVIQNAIDVARMRRPADFHRDDIRRGLGFSEDDKVFAFVALGHFERKGLPILIEAVAQTRQSNIKLLIVGGRDTLVAPYRKQANDLGLGAQVVFAGSQADVRPLLWAADAFAFPSFYEAFSLVILEAAAAGLPIIAPLINGVEEILDDGHNGYVVSHSAESVSAALTRFAALDRAQRDEMGLAAARAVEQFNHDRFGKAWRDLYGRLTRVEDAAHSAAVVPVDDQARLRTAPRRPDR
jgi:glycosyltransferase involved in cell wall biosynthesis